ncbi:hypothetical protein J6590_028079 [Homalodisca vitripennis]|nr:hypothetical protein J6590_028079 [Homalodisca vitripennis]
MFINDLMESTANVYVRLTYVGVYNDSRVTGTIVNSNVNREIATIRVNVNNYTFTLQLHIVLWVPDTVLCSPARAEGESAISWPTSSIHS